MNSEIFQLECDSYYGKCQGIIHDFLNRIVTNDNSSSLNTTSSRDLLFSNITIESLCKCIYFVNECSTKSNLLDTWIKNIYLAFYVALVVAALLVICLTFGLLMNDHKKFNPLEIIKNLHKKFEKTQNLNEIKLKSKQTNKSGIRTHIRRLNAASDFLIICLLFSYLLIILYVVPNQAYLFYFNKNVLTSNCKSSEFLKAFAVSFSIYCLVAVALQRLFAIKFGYLITPINSKLIYSINHQSCIGFIRSLFDLVYAFLFSPYYRQYLTTALLATFKWLISISIGLYNMSLYSTNTAQLISDDSFKLQFAECIETLPASSTCKRNNNEESISDIIFVIALLLMPNLIVFSSYSWICYHVYSNGIKFKKSVEVILINSSNKRRKNSREKKLKPTFELTVNSDLTSKKVTDIEMREKKSLISCVRDSSTRHKISTKEVSSNFNSIQLHANQLLNTNSQISLNRRNKSVILTTCLMVTCFTICWSPFFILPMFYKLIDTNTYINLKVIIHLVGYSSSIWNPIILIIKSKRFKFQLRNFTFRIRNFNSLIPLKRAEKITE